MRNAVGLNDRPSFPKINDFLHCAPYYIILLCILDTIIIFNIMDNSPQIKQVKLSQCYKVDFHLELVSIFTPGMEKCFKPFPELIQR